MFARWFPRAPLAALFVLSTLPIISLSTSALGQGVLVVEPNGRPIPFPRPPIFHPPPMPIPPATYRIKSLDVRANVVDQVARVQISQTFLNTGGQPLEAKFVFPLPPDAAIDQLTLMVDGKELTGHILKAEDAKRIYEDIVRRSRDPALLEWMGWGLLQTNVFPIPPGAERIVQIRYSQICRKDHGLIECVFPLGTARYTAEAPNDVRVQFNIEASAPIRNIYSPTHNIDIQRSDDCHAIAKYSSVHEAPNSDFRLFYDTHASPVGASVISYRPSSGEDGYFLLMATPEVKASDRERSLKTIELVLDRSGSMEGKKIEQARNALKYVVERLHEGDLFNIVVYDDKIESFRSELQRFNEDTRRAALAYVEGIFAGGSTNIDGALATALRQINPDGATAIHDNPPPYELSPMALANLPADGRHLRVRIVRRDVGKIIDPGITPGLIQIKIDEVKMLTACAGRWSKFSDLADASADSTWVLEGAWVTRNAERWLVIDSASQGQTSAPLSTDRPKYIVFLTDGLPTTGERNEMKIVENARLANAARARMVVFGVGYDVNSRLLDKLARGNFGQSEYVRPDEDIEAHVSRLYNRIGSPVMTDVAVTFSLDTAGEGGPVTNRVYPKDVYDLFEGDQLVLAGRYRQSGPAAITIKGKVNGKEEQYRFSTELARPTGDTSYSFVEKLWATRRIGEILDQLDLNGRNQELVDELVALSTKHGILTPYTSFLADERNDIRAITANVNVAREELGRLSDASGRSGVAQRASKSAFQNAPATATAAPREASMRDFDDKEVSVKSVQNVGNKTFYQRSQGWLDSTVTAEQEKKAIKLVQFSDDYFKLATRNGQLLAQLPVSGQAVFINLDGQCYRVDPPETK